MESNLNCIAKASAFVLAANFGLTGSPGIAQSGDIAKAKVSAALYVVDSRLRDVIDVLGTVSEARIVQSDAIAGRVSEKQLSGTLDELLTILANEHELDWFAFNGQYYVSLRRETVSRVIKLGRLSAKDARAALVDAGLVQQSLRIMDGSDGASLILSGAPRLVAFCEVIIANIPEFDAEVASNHGIIVRRGVKIYREPTYATATDDANQLPPESSE